MDTQNTVESLRKQVEMLESKYAMQTALLQQLTLEAGKMESALDFLSRHDCLTERMPSGVSLTVFDYEDEDDHYFAKTLLECVRLAKQSGKY